MQIKNAFAPMLNIFNCTFQYVSNFLIAALTVLCKPKYFLALLLDFQKRDPVKSKQTCVILQQVEARSITDKQHLSPNALGPISTHFSFLLCLLSSQICDNQPLYLKQEICQSYIAWQSKSSNYNSFHGVLN